MSEDPVIRDLFQHYADMDRQDDLDRIVEDLEKHNPERVEGLNREQKLLIAEAIYEDELLESILRKRGL